MVAKTIGFNWGPAGTSCGVWTGVRLADILQRCGVRSAAQGASHVCFRGPRHELPQGAPGRHQGFPPKAEANFLSGPPRLCSWVRHVVLLISFRACSASGWGPVQQQ